MTKQRRASNFSVLFLVLVIFLCLSWIWQMNSSAPQLDYAQVKVLGFVLNGVELEKSSYGYGKSRYSRYRRYGRYGYGYGQQSAPAKPVEQAET